MIVGRGMGRAKGITVSGGFIVAMGMGKVVQNFKAFAMRISSPAKDLDRSSTVEGR